jgi:hypothetical protein
VPGTLPSDFCFEPGGKCLPWLHVWLLGDASGIFRADNLPAGSATFFVVARQSLRRAHPHRRTPCQPHIEHCPRLVVARVLS